MSTARKRLALDDVRRLYPVRAPGAEWTEAGGEIRVVVRRRPGLLARGLSWLFTAPARRSFLLDRDGAVVWRLCDGRTPVDGVASALREAHGWPAEAAERAVLQYLSTLSERRLVGFRESPAAESQAA